MPSIDKILISNHLKQTITDLDARVRAVCANSQTAAAANLEPGETFTKPGAYAAASDAAKKEALDACNNALAEVKSYCDGERKRVFSSLIEAPTPEAVNTLTVLRMRDDVTADELSQIATVFSDNYQVQKALADIASNNGVNFDSPSLTDIKTIDAMGHAAESAINAIGDAVTFEKRTTLAVEIQKANLDEIAENGVTLTGQVI